MNVELFEKVVKTESDQVKGYAVFFGPQSFRVFLDKARAGEFKRLCLDAGVDPETVYLEKLRYNLVEADN